MPCRISVDRALGNLRDTCWRPSPPRRTEETNEGAGELEESQTIMSATCYNFCDAVAQRKMVDRRPGGCALECVEEMHYPADSGVDLLQPMRGLRTGQGR